VFGNVDPFGNCRRWEKSNPNGRFEFAGEDSLSVGFEPPTGRTQNADPSCAGLSDEDVAAIRRNPHHAGPLRPSANSSALNPRRQPAARPTAVASPRAKIRRRWRCSWFWQISRPYQPAHTGLSERQVAKRGVARQRSGLRRQCPHRQRALPLRYTSGGLFA
jgi:hypothetical protein